VVQLVKVLNPSEEEDALSVAPSHIMHGLCNSFPLSLINSINPLLRSHVLPGCFLVGHKVYYNLLFRDYRSLQE
jgi:hypothetical protein